MKKRKVTRDLRRGDFLSRGLPLKVPSSQEEPPLTLVRSVRPYREGGSSLLRLRPSHGLFGF